MIRCQRSTVCALLVALLIAVWAALAVWQYREYAYERDLTQQTLQRQAEAVRNALVGGINSHRRMRTFFESQIGGVLQEIAKAEDILAVGIRMEGSDAVIEAGRTDLLRVPQSEVGGCFHYVDTFDLVPSEIGSTGSPEGDQMHGGGYGRGLGSGVHARGEVARFGEGGTFRLVLVLDRSQFDVHDRRAFWLRMWVVIAGGLVLACVAAAWIASVWYLDARGRTRVLESEARRLREMSQAAAGLAHETRNPLGLVRGWTQRLAKLDLGSDDVRRQATAVVEECDRVTARINQFLSFARPCEPKSETVDLVELIGELGIILEPDLDSKGLMLVPSTDRPRPTALIDREMFRQALFNLITNAIHFSPDEGQVEVCITAGVNGYCRIEVMDRGPGASDESAERLFTPYYTTRPGGTGLGLAIVRRIAEAHGWTVGYTPRTGGGATFWLDQSHAR